LDNRLQNLVSQYLSIELHQNSFSNFFFVLSNYMSKGVEITNSLYSDLWQISPLTFEWGVCKPVHGRAICHKKKIDSGHRHDQAAIRCDSLCYVVLNQKTKRSAL